MRVLLLLFCCTFIQAALAKEDCYKYEDDSVSLTGIVESKTFYGPPNYGENPETDAKETQAHLKLSKPICTIENAKDYEEAESNQEYITLVPGKDMMFSKLIGKKVTVVGSLFHAFTAHHHTSVLMSVKEIKNVQN